MRIKYEVLSMHDFHGGMVGWFAFQRTGFEKACYVWDADVAGDDPQFADTVLCKKDYLSIRTKRNNKEYHRAIAETLLGEPYNFDFSSKEPGIIQVRRSEQ